MNWPTIAFLMLIYIGGVVIGYANGYIDGKGWK